MGPEDFEAWSYFSMNLWPLHHGQGFRPSNSMESTSLTRSEKGGSLRSCASSKSLIPRNLTLVVITGSVFFKRCPLPPHFGQIVNLEKKFSRALMYSSLRFGVSCEGLGSFLTDTHPKSAIIDPLSSLDLLRRSECSNYCLILFDFF